MDNVELIAREMARIAETSLDAAIDGGEMSDYEWTQRSLWQNYIPEARALADKLKKGA